ncbi:MAG: FadR/GntR family transcriptional regulator [Bacteroidales bacterium]
MEPVVIERRSLVEQAADALRARIAEGEWPIGSRIPPEAELVRSLGISRNTLREAVRCLAYAGMLEVRQGDGTYVRAVADGGEALRRIARASLRDQIEVRCALEEAAARLAARRRSDADVAMLIEARDRCASLSKAGQLEDYVTHDFAFHRGMVAIAGNPALEELYLYCAAAIRAGIRTSVGDSALNEPTEAQHRAVLDAIARQDADGAAAAVRALFAPLLATLDSMVASP